MLGKGGVSLSSENRNCGRPSRSVVAADKGGVVIQSGV